MKNIKVKGICNLCKLSNINLVNIISTDKFILDFSLTKTHCPQCGQKIDRESQGFDWIKKCKKYVRTVEARLKRKRVHKPPTLGKPLSISYTNINPYDLWKGV